MIKAAVFDLGGVLFSEGKEQAADELARQYGYDRDLILKVFVSPRSVDLRKGVITNDEFWDNARGELPGGYDVSRIQEAWHKGYILDEDIHRLIQTLKGQYKIIAFSDNTRDRIDFLESRYGFRKLFDLEVYSFEHGLSKQDRRFTELMIRESGCEPTGLVYVDDDQEKVAAARELGVNVLVYRAGHAGELTAGLRRLDIIFREDPDESC